MNSVAWKWGRRAAESVTTLLMICSIACVWGTGCNGNEPTVERVQLSGEVTWNGSPLATGLLRLVPVSGTEAQPSGAEIKDGHYVVANKGGVIPGTYRVEITATRIAKDTPPPDGESVAMEQFLPDKVNRNSQLTLTVASGSGSVKQDFSLRE